MEEGQEDSQSCEENSQPSGQSPVSTGGQDQESSEEESSSDLETDSMLK